jgi:hypothetical protein
VRLDQFPVHVTLLPDEVQFDARILVHRRIAIPHDDHASCACEPHSFTREQIQSLTCDDLNRLLDADDN